MSDVHDRETRMDERTFWVTLWTRLMIAFVTFTVALSTSCAAENAYRNHLIAESDDPLSVACATGTSGATSSMYACPLAGRK